MNAVFLQTSLGCPCRVTQDDPVRELLRGWLHDDSDLLPQPLVLILVVVLQIGVYMCPVRSLSPATSDPPNTL